MKKILANILAFMIGIDSQKSKLIICFICYLDKNSNNIIRTKSEFLAALSNVTHRKDGGNRAGDEATPAIYYLINEDTSRFSVVMQDIDI